MTCQGSPLPTRESTRCATAFTKMSPVIAVSAKRNGPRWARIMYLARTPFRIAAALDPVRVAVVLGRAVPTPGKVAVFAATAHPDVPARASLLEPRPSPA